MTRVLAVLFAFLICCLPTNSEAQFVGMGPVGGGRMYNFHGNGMAEQMRRDQNRELLAAMQREAQRREEQRLEEQRKEAQRREEQRREEQRKEEQRREEQRKEEQRKEEQRREKETVKGKAEQLYEKARQEALEKRQAVEAAKAKMQQDAATDQENGNLDLAERKLEAADELGIYYGNNPQKLAALKETIPTEVASQSYPIVNNLNSETYTGYMIIKKANEFSADSEIMNDSFLYDFTGNSLLLLKNDSGDLVKFSVTYTKMENILHTARRTLHSFGMGITKPIFEAAHSTIKVAKDFVTDPVGTSEQALEEMLHIVEAAMPYAQNPELIVNAAKQRMDEFIAEFPNYTAEQYAAFFGRCIGEGILFAVPGAGASKVLGAEKYVIKHTEFEMTEAIRKATSFVPNPPKDLTNLSYHHAVNPGDLHLIKEGSGTVADTFRSGTYMKGTANEDILLYRVFSDPKDPINPGNRLGAYWSREEPNKPLQVIMDSALPPFHDAKTGKTFINTAENYIVIKVPKGETFYQGHVGPIQAKSKKHDIPVWTLHGGGSQIYINTRIPESWVIHEGKLHD